MAFFLHMRCSRSPFHDLGYVDDPNLGCKFELLTGKIFDFVLPCKGITALCVLCSRGALFA